MNFTLAELAEASRGRLLSGNPRRIVRRIGTDTRILRASECFLALDGKNYRGSEFIDQAIAKGAAGVITTMTAPPEGFPSERFFISVDDTTTALGDIAREWRMIVDPTVCAITGSSGKTTTKEMLSFICRRRFKHLATDGNFNNLIGLPLTLLRLKEEHEVAIVETGMNMPGELTRLGEICIPDISIITNIGNAHIGNFGSVENLIRAKAELFEATPRDGTAIINADCPHASIMAEAFKIPEMVISYGQGDQADVQARNVRLLDPYGYEFELRILDSRHRVRLDVFGRYQVSNALAAAAAAAALGVEPAEIAERLCEFHAPSMRAQTEWLDGALVISDCYNASPDATMASLRSLADIAGLSRRYAVLGDMLELGDQVEKFHRRVGIAAAEAQIDFLCTIGANSEFIREEAERLGIAARHFASADEVAEFLDRKLRAGDGLLVKGSRGMKLEQVLLRLREMRSAVRSGDVVPISCVEGI